jgi:uncharacterized protein involved in response to NO
MAIPRLRSHREPALLSYGFRPFFLFGSMYAGIAVLIWLPMFHGEIAISTLFMPRDWHMHEMLFGFVAAVVTGFLLTAIPNWTGRLPIQGAALLCLVVVWAGGALPWHSRPSLAGSRPLLSIWHSWPWWRPLRHAKS